MHGSCRSWRWVILPRRQALNPRAREQFGVRRLATVILIFCLAGIQGLSATYGLDERKAVAPFLNRAFPEDLSAVSGSWSTVKAFPNLSFEDPVNLTFAPRSTRMYVCGRQGQIWSFENNPGTSAKTTVLDIRSRVQGYGLCGLLGMAFHPEFGLPGSPNRGYFYVHYRYSTNPFVGPGLVPSGSQGFNRLSRFTIPDGSSVADPESEQILVSQYCRHTWHNGGSVLFGPDGYLYWSAGDEGEGAALILFSAQRINRGLFGGVFRIDVDKNPARSHPIRRQPLSASPDLPVSFSANYYIPNDNPWQDPDGGVLEEYFALGFRSPHRISFDFESGHLWLGDVGASLYEEVNLVEKGKNYQWPDREGTSDFPMGPFTPSLGVQSPPVHQFKHENGLNCIIGGYVYRGPEHRVELGGKYIFADNGSGRIWAMDYDGVNDPRVTYLCNMPPGAYHTGISTFGTDHQGELYMCHLGNGQIYKLSSSISAGTVPKLISQTGFLSDPASFRVADTMIPYQMNVPFWSDGAIKSRWFAVPGTVAPYGANETVGFSSNGFWNFPAGSVFVKHFELPIDESNPAILKRLETRFLIRNTNGYVYGLTYKWRADGTDADLLTTSLQEEISIRTLDGGERKQTWYYPSRQECLACHNTQSKGVLGVTARQLNREFLYPQTGRTDNQLRALNHVGLFSPPIQESDIPHFPTLTREGEDVATLERRARSYLDANCSYCHNPAVGAAYFDARYETPLVSQNLINGLFNNPLGLESPSIITPGSTSRSILYHRLSSLDTVRMPPLGRNVVDTNGVLLIATWIDSLPPRISSVPRQTLFEDTPSAPILFTVEDVQTPASALIVSVASSDSSLIPVDGLALGGSGSQRQLIITPSRDRSGTAEISLTVRDSFNTESVTRFSVTVQPVNDAPTIALIPGHITQEATPIGPISVTIADPESPASALTVSASSSDSLLVPPSGLVLDGSGGVRGLTITPAPLRFGTAVIRVVVSDEGLSSATEFLLQVNSTTLVQTNAVFFEAEAAEHTPPVLVQPDPTASGGAYASSAVAGQGGMEFPVLALTSGDYSVWARVWITGQGLAGFGVKVDSAPEDIFDLPIEDGGQGRWQWVPLNGRGGAQPFAINPRLLRLTPGAHTLRFRPLSAAARLDRILYSVDRTFVPDDAPVAEAFELTTLEDTPVDVTLRGVDPERRPLAYRILAQPQHGRLTGNPPLVSFSPDPDFAGTDSFSYWVNDGQLDSSVAVVRVTVQPVNDPPTLSSIPNVVVDEDLGWSVPFVVGDVESVAGELVLSASSSNETLIPSTQLRITGEGADRVLAGDPLPNQSGTALITLRVTDPQGGTSSRDFTLTVSSINDLPSLSALPDQRIPEDHEGLLIPFRISDFETASASLQVTVSSSNRDLFLGGDLAVRGDSEDRQLSLRPAPHAFGESQVTVEVLDTQGGSARTVFRVLVDPVNDAPTVALIEDLVIDQNAGPTVVPFEVADAESAADQLLVSVWSSNPRLVSSSGLVLGGSGASRTLTVTPVAGRFGDAEILIQVADEAGATVVGKLRCRVRSSANAFAPSITEIEPLILLEDHVSESISFTVQDAATPPDQLSILAIAANPSLISETGLVIQGTGAERTLVITPARDASGTTTVYISARNQADGLAVRSFEVTVQPVNDAPQVVGLRDLILQEDAASEVIPFDVQDVDASPGSQALVQVRSSDEGLVPASGLHLEQVGLGWSLQVRPGANASGTATVTVTATDAEGARGESQFQVSVQPVNDPPTLAAIEDLITGEDVPLAPIRIQVTDRESPALAVQLTASSSNPSLVQDSGFEFAIVDENPYLVIHPNANRSGSATITVNATDPDGGVTSLSFLLTVQPINDAPRVQTVASLTVPLGTEVPLVEAAVEDLESDASLLVLLASSSNPVLLPESGIVLGGSGSLRTVSLSPAPGRFGNVDVTLMVRDPEGQSSSNVFRLIVTHPDGLQPPSISGLRDLETMEDVPVTLSGILIQDPDSSLDSLSITAVSQNLVLLPQEGVSLQGTGEERSLVLSPGLNQYGATRLLFTVLGPNGGVSSAWIALQVQAVNDAPTVTVPALIEMDEDTPSTPVLLTFSDDALVSQLLAIRWTSENGELLSDSSLVFTPGGGGLQLVIHPNPNAAGLARVVLEVTDGEGASAILPIQVNIRPVNDLPSIGEVATTILTPEDTASTPIVIPVADVETAAGDLLLSLEVSNPDLIAPEGVSFGGSGTARTLSVTPRPDASGTAELTLVLRDQDGGEVRRPLALTVVPVNDPPVLPELPPIEMVLGEAGATLSFNLSDLESPAEEILVYITSDNSLLVPPGSTQVHANGTQRILTITPAPGLFGVATLLVEAQDPQGASSLREVRFTVRHPTGNQPPEISSIAEQSTSEDVPRSEIQLIVSDVESAPEELTLIARSTNSEVLADEGIQILGTGSARTLNLSPILNQSGIAGVVLILRDPHGGVAVRQFPLTVSAVNDAPSLEALSDVTVDEDQPVPPIPLLLSDIESDVQLLAVSVGLPEGSGLRLDQIAIEGIGAERVLKLTPDTNQYGTFELTVRVDDGRGGITRRSFVLTIRPVADAPRISELASVVLPEDSLLEGIEFTVSDPDTPLNQLQVEVSSDNSELLPAANLVVTGTEASRRLRLVPVADRSGSANVTILVRDLEGAQASTQFTVTVTPVNDAPEIAPIANLEGLEDQVGLGVDVTLSDRDDQPSVLRVVGRSQNQALLPDAGITVTGTGLQRRLNLSPRADRFGQARVFVSVYDANGDIATTFFDVTLRPVNDAPTLDAPKDITLAFLSSPARIPLTGLGAGGFEEVQGLSLSVSSANPTLLPTPEIQYVGGDNRATLVLSPVVGAFGESRVTITVQDDGPLDLGGANTTVRSFLVNVLRLPRLTAVRSPRPALILTWPGWATDYVLETRLATETAWSQVPDRVSKVGEEFRVQLDIARPTRYFRLRRIE
ncbi:MAG: tandem-95 repeat protein [Verrucomicrobiales bacterium]|nr:tandem-95 repeat protein [Verrucomicrobiales bacterium]